MPRTQGTKIENNFVNGLVTETTALQFPENAARDTYDCIFDRTGRVTRRPGFDVEAANALTSRAFSAAEVVTEFLWENVGGVSSKSFYVTQLGNFLYFYDVSSSTSLDANKESFTVNLQTYVPGGSSLVPFNFPCDYTTGNGDLFVVNGACEPIYVKYSASGDTISESIITIRIRDLVGVYDGYSLSERPLYTQANLATANPQHYYNLYNQGWFQDPLSQWDTDRNDMPSNSDVVSLYRVDATDAYGSTQVSSRTNFQNSAAPKGHFILSAFKPDRVAAVNSEAEYDITDNVTNGLIGQSTGTTNGMYDTDTNVGNAFDATLNYTTTNYEYKTSATTAYIGKNFGTPGKRIVAADCFGSTGGFVTGASPNVTLTLRASNTVPSNFATDGTQLGSNTSPSDGTPGPSAISITSNDDVTYWQYVWVYMTHDGAANNFGMSELNIYTPLDQGITETLSASSVTTYSRPSVVSFFAQRVWYTGIDDDRHNTTLYFSQLIDGRDKYGDCFQQNDPTNEDIFDLLATDGGYIRIPDIANIKALYTYQDSLLVFATNGVWQIKGGTGGFAADDYLVRKITSVGIVASKSLIGVQGAPVYWGDDGINSITYQLEADSFVARSLTDDKIKTFITNIPEYNRKFIKTVYDSVNQKAYSLYNPSTTLATDSAEYTYTNVLVADARTQAFYPWTIGDNDLDIKGLGFVRTADRTVASEVKYTIAEPVDASNKKFGFAEVNNTTSYRDWTQYSVDSVDSSQEIDYTSYFETGFYIHAEGTKHFQPTYIVVFMDVEAEAGLTLQGVFDFASSSSSMRYSTAQQCYNDETMVNLAFRSISMRRLKIRGKGRSLSLRFVCEPDKPFSLIGWSLYETGNSSV